MVMSEQSLRHSDSGKESNPPPPQNTLLQFNVVISDKGGPLSYELKATNANSAPYLKGPNKQTIGLPKGADWYDIVFHVVDTDSSQKIKFDQKQPICALIGTSCPASGSGNKTNNQLTTTDIKDRKLTLENRNQDPPVQIAYTLFFVDGQNKPIDPPFDPIMDNGGGGRI